MTTFKGFAAMTAIYVVIGLVVLGGAGYVAMNPEVLQAPAENTEETATTTPVGSKQVGAHAVSWQFVSLGENADGMPQTRVMVSIDGQLHDAGTYLGSCSEVGAEGGVDGKGLLAGELSAAQCWFAGGGNEIGLFAHEDGGVDIMVGELGEGDAENPGFRGNFEVKIAL